MKLCITTDGQDLPADAVTQKFGFLGRSGSGKTYAAGKFVEELLDQGAQVVVVDPVGVWWGLRLAAAGPTDGTEGFEIPIFGGQHGDIPLQATAGNLSADVVVDHGQSLVLDVSEFNGSEQRRFVTDFAVRLLHRKKKSRSPMMVVWEECQDFVPQRVFGEVAKMVGAMERLIKQGRNFGIGTSLISQRPQAVNKDVLNQTEALICFQLTGPQERKAIEGWVVDKGLDKHQLLEELPSLPVGQAFFWSPQWLQSLRKVKFAKKRTYDTSATPVFGKNSVQRELAPIDLKKIEKAMEATVEKAKETDPNLLRTEVYRLKALLAKTEKHTAPRAVEKVVEKIVERVPLLSKIDQRRLERLDKWAVEMGEDLRKLAQSLTEMKGVLAAPQSTLRPKAVPLLPRSAPLMPTSKYPWAQFEKPHEPRAPKIAYQDGTKVPKGAREMLRALAARHPTPLTRQQLATLAGMAPGSGGFNNYVGMLRTVALIQDSERGQFNITDTGLAFLGDKRPAVVHSTDELLELWCAKLTGKAKDMLRFVAAHPTEYFTRDEIAEAVGMQPGSGGFNNYLSSLKNNGLIMKVDHTFKASDTLFM